MKKIISLAIFSLILISKSSAIGQNCYTGIGCFPIPDNTQEGGRWIQRYQSYIDAIVPMLLDSNRTFKSIDTITKNANGTYSGKIYLNYSSQYVLLVNNLVTGIMCGNGHYFGYYYNACANGAIDAPTCTQCYYGSTMNNNQCVCNNGASNAPACDQCGTGLSLYNNLCVCANGATNSPTCNTCLSGSTMQNNQCVCSNGATPQSNCSQCPAGKVMDAGQCVDGCSMTNVCGQQAQGVMKNGTCTAPSGSGGNINNSCITTFNVSSDHVNPNGAVDFSWSLATLPNNVSSKCGFVDLTTPTPRPIPGLQNLDPSVDRTRITNIQSTTRFCLICQFYNALNNNPLGDAVQHQWIKVIRVGEN